MRFTARMGNTVTHTHTQAHLVRMSLADYLATASGEVVEYDRSSCPSSKDEDVNTVQ